MSLHVKSDFTKGRVKIGESITVNRMLTDDSDPGNLVGSSLRAVPAYSVYTADGEYTKTGESLITKVYNPVGTLNINHARTTTTNILANLYAEVNLIEGLKFRSSVEAGNNDDKRIYHSKKHDLGFGDTYAFNVAQNNANNYNYWQIDNTLSYEKTIAQKHSLNVVIGQSALDYRKSAFSAQDQGMADGLWDLNTGQTAGVGASVSGSSSENTLASYFGRVLYSYDNRYGFMALMRRDGSSRFGKLNPWGNFPSLSAHWNVANESFFKNLATPVTELKIRASWGKNGNQEIGDYKYIATIGQGVNYVNNSGVWYGATGTGFVSNNMKWEETAQKNLGLDLGLWNGKLNYTFDYYNKITTGILMQSAAPHSSGVSDSPWINAGNISNKGLKWR